MTKHRTRTYGRTFTRRFPVRQITHVPMPEWSVGFAAKNRSSVCLRAVLCVTRDRGHRLRGCFDKPFRPAAVSSTARGPGSFAAVVNASEWREPPATASRNGTTCPEEAEGMPSWRCARETLGGRPRKTWKNTGARQPAGAVGSVDRQRITRSDNTTVIGRAITTAGCPRKTADARRTGR